MPRHPVVAFAHQGADRGRGGVEDRYAEPVRCLPETPEVGIVGHAVEHHRGRTIGERAVDDIAVAGDPAHVRGAPENIVLPSAEQHVEGGGHPVKIAAGRVHHALGLAGRT